jgi:hypothetical protein
MQTPILSALLTTGLRSLAVSRLEIVQFPYQTQLIYFGPRSRGFQKDGVSASNSFPTFIRIPDSSVSQRLNFAIST